MLEAGHRLRVPYMAREWRQSRGYGVAEALHHMVGWCPAENPRVAISKGTSSVAVEAPGPKGLRENLAWHHEKGWSLGSEACKGPWGRKSRTVQEWRK